MAQLTPFIFNNQILWQNGSVMSWETIGDSGGSYVAAYQTVYDAFSTKPDTAIATAQNTMISSLVDASIWNRMDLFYVMANNSSDNAKKNWANPTTFNLTDGSIVTSTFTAYEGFVNNTGSYFKTGYFPSSSRINMSMYSITLGTYIRTNIIQNYGCPIGVAGDISNRELFIYPRHGGLETIYGCLNSYESGGSVSTTTSQGLSMYTGRGSGNTEIYKNGISVETPNRSIDYIPTYELYVGAKNNVGVVEGNYDGQMSIVFLMNAVTSNDASIIYNAIQTYMAEIGTAVFDSPQYQVVYNSFSTKPTGTVALAQNSMVKSLVSNGLWDRMDLFYVFANNASDNALINWKNPGTYNAAAFEGTAFTLNEGFTGNGSSGYINTYNPSTNSTNYSVNSAGIGIYLRTNLTENFAVFGACDGPNFIVFSPRTPGDLAQTMINTPSGTMDTTITDTQGLFIASRNSSSNTTLYRNITRIDSETEISGSVPNAPLHILRRNNIENYSSHQVSAFFTMNGVSDSDVSTLYPIIQTYITALGKQV